MKPTKPHRTTTILKKEGDVFLSEIAIVWGATPYVYYEIYTPEKAIYEKNYFIALMKYYKKININHNLMHFINA